MILFRGLIMGFVIAIPLGPVGILCIERTLRKGRVSGFISGLGAATGDTFYAIVAIFGLTFISRTLYEYHLFIEIVGGIFLIFTGLYFFLAKKPLTTPEHPTYIDELTDFISACILTLMNPLTILFSAAVFAGGNIGIAIHHFFPALLLVIGVFVGSCMCWLLVTITVDTIKKRSQFFSLEKVNKVSGLAIFAFGIIVLIEILK